jgi:hypothetical protein
MCVCVSSHHGRRPKALVTMALGGLRSPLCALSALLSCWSFIAFCLNQLPERSPVLPFLREALLSWPHCSPGLCVAAVLLL